MVVWLFQFYGCFLLGSTEHKVRFTLVSGAVESVVGNPVASAGGASASHGESGFWKNRADPHSVRAAKLVFPNGTVQGYYKSEQEAAESLAFFKKNNMFGKDCTVVVSSGRQMLPSGRSRIVYANGAFHRITDLRSGAGQSIMSALGMVASAVDEIVDLLQEEYPGVDWVKRVEYPVEALVMPDGSVQELKINFRLRGQSRVVYISVSAVSGRGASLRSMEV